MPVISSISKSYRHKHTVSTAYSRGNDDSHSRIRDSGEASLDDSGEPESARPLLIRSGDTQHNRTTVLASPTSLDLEVAQEVECPPIASASEECKELFSGILSLQSKDPGPSKRELAVDTNIDAIFPEIAETFDRYRIWSANMGTYDNGYSIMDHRLRDTSNVADQVDSLLCDLRESLRDVSNTISGDGGSGAQNTESDKPVEPNEQIPSDPDTLLEQILADIGLIVRCLYRLSNIIKDPAPHDHIMSNLTIDTSNKPTDIQRMEMKHPNISEELVERLADANSQRRAYFGYRRSKHNLAQPSTITQVSHPHMGISTAPARALSPRTVLGDLESSDSSRSKVKGREDGTEKSILQHQQSPETSASVPEAINAPPLSARAFPNIQSKTGRSNVALLLADRMKEKSEREYISLSTVSVPVDDKDNSETFKELETLEKLDLGQSLFSQCPLCWAVVCDMTKAGDWRKHIFSDLRPYICVENDCPESIRLFENHQEWIQHVRQGHWMQWVCTAGCSTSFDREVDLVRHLQAHHDDLVNGHLDTLVALSRRPGLGFHEMECPFCLEMLTTEVHYQRHIGYHQELLAFLALPLMESHGAGKDDSIEPSISADKVDLDDSMQSAKHTRTLESVYRRPEDLDRLRGHTYRDLYASDYGYSSHSSASKKRYGPGYRSANIRWSCSSCTSGNNNSWDYDFSCPFCFTTRPVAPDTFYG